MSFTCGSGEDFGAHFSEPPILAFLIFWVVGGSRLHPILGRVVCGWGQGALKGTNLRGQTEPKRRFSLIFADSRLFPENKAFGKRRFSQKTADFRRETAEKTAGTRRKPQIGVCPLRFVPLSRVRKKGSFGKGVFSEKSIF